jgi:hypothetical protein
MNENFIKTDAKIYIDGKEVENFSISDAPIIEANEAQSNEINKLFDSYSATITLNRKQSKRLWKAFKKAERKWKRKQFFAKIKNIFKGGI